MRQLIYLIAITFSSFSCSQNSTQEKVSQKDSVALPKDSVVQKPDTSAISAGTLSVVPLDNNGDQGQVTFVQAGKTLFYYNYKTKKGKINLNGTEYNLDKFSFNSKTNSYTLSNNQVKIDAPNFKYVNDEGSGDCSYGNAPVATITSGNSILKLQKVEVQDCPDY